jgi:hypothetical protein
MKFPSRLFVLIFGFLFALRAQALPTVEKGLLSSILPNLQILFEGDQNLPVFVEVASIDGDGECQEPSSACEQNALYVVISDNEELPVTSVTYSLGKAHEWAFQSVTRCAGPKADLCAKVVLDETLTDAAGKAWKIVHHVYEFRMDSVKEIGATK